MIVRKSFQFRLYPTKKQAKALQAQLDECRWLYNELLAQRKLSHEELEISLSKYQQSMFLPLFKEERPALSRIHSQVLQNVVDLYGYKATRDLNAAQNILALGLDGLGAIPRRLCP